MKNAIFLCDPDVRIVQQIVVEYSDALQKDGAWTVHVLPHCSPLPQLQKHIGDIKPDAIAAWAPSPALADYLLELRIPQVVVAVEGAARPATPTILPDEEAIGAMAAEYLLRQKYEHFALVDQERPEQTPRARRSKPMERVRFLVVSLGLY